MPVDVTESMVRDCADELTREYPGLRVHGVIGDFERHLDRVPRRRRVPASWCSSAARSATSPPAAAGASCARSPRCSGRSDHLLMGTDLVKDPGCWRPPTTISQGVTAEFNRNVLHVLNRELDADFDPERLRPRGAVRPPHEWIEMRLRARRAHTVTVCARCDLAVHFEPARRCAPRSAPSSRAARLERATCARRAGPLRSFALAHRPDGMRASSPAPPGGSHATRTTEARRARLPPQCGSRAAQRSSSAGPPGSARPPCVACTPPGPS